MSRALVPAPSGPNFAQQGQVDWVTLSSSTVAFGFDVLARLSKADIQPATVAMGGVIGSGFDLPAAVQKSVRQALATLPSFQSYGSLIWFGFGVKSITRALADSEQGMVCVTLCACLAVTYNSFHAAEVLRELCKLRKSPPDYIPSMYQWDRLVGVCAGAVSTSKFPSLFEGFLRLTNPHPNLSVRNPASAQALAQALVALADVSQGNLANITLVGGPDCLWLAAIAEWMLLLKVEILNSGKEVYRSPDTQPELVHVTVIYDESEDLDEGRRGRIFTNRCHVIPMGSKLLGLPGLDDVWFIGGRSPWNCILTDAFGTSFEVLLQETVIEEFAMLLLTASIQAESYHHLNNFEDGLHTPCLSFEGFHFSRSSSRGQGFLEFAASRLPELSPVINRVQFAKKRYPRPYWKDSLEQVKLACACQSCTHENAPWDDLPQICLGSLIQTILVLLWILSVVEVGEPIEISPQGLRLLHAELGFSHGGFRSDILSTVLALFSGTKGNGQDNSGTFPSALSSNGICVYFKAFENLDLPPESISTVRVALGHIRFGNIVHNVIFDPTRASTTHPPMQPMTASVSCELLIEELRQPGSIAASYRLSNSELSHVRSLGISALAKATAEFMHGPTRCTWSCQDWNFPLYPRQALHFSSKSSKEGVNNTEMQPLTQAWALVVPEADGGLKVSMIFAPIITLYSALVGKKHAVLTHFNACRTCAVRCAHSSLIKAKRSRNRTHYGRILSGKSRDSLTVLVPNQTGGWTKDILTFTMIVRASNPSEEVILKNNPSVSRDLLDRKYDLDFRDEKGLTALHIAAELGHEGMLRSLLLAGADIYATSNSGQTALHIALKSGQHNMAKLLLKAGSKLGFRDGNDRVPGDYLTRIDWKFLREILENVAKVGDAVTPTLPVVETDDKTAVKILVEHGALQNIQTAEYRGSKYSTIVLGAVGLLLNSSPETVETRAPQRGNTGSPLVMASTVGDPWLVRCLLDNGPVLDSREIGRSLECALDKRRSAVIKVLLEKGGGNVSITISYYRSHHLEFPLEIATKDGYEEAVKMLLEHGINPNPPAPYQTPLQIAAARGYDAVVRLFLQYGAAIKPKNQHGTPAQLAQTNGHQGVVRLLQEHEISLMYSFNALPSTPFQLVKQWWSCGGPSDLSHPLSYD